MKITPRSLNLDAIYANGFDAIILNREHLQCLQNAMSGTEWVSDPEGVFNGVPNWKLPEMGNFQNKAEKEQEFNAQSLREAPEKLILACRKILESDSLMGGWKLAFDFEIKFLSLWDGAEPLDWHWDGPANAGFFFLIYLNDRPGWKDEWGGHLQIGIRSLSGNYLRTTDSPVDLIASISPASRTLVCCNNQNPRFVHKVVALSGNHQRKVLMLGFDAVATLKGQAR